LVGGVLHGAGRWWPAFPLAAGLAIFFRSIKPGPHIKSGPHIAVAIGLISAACIAFAITRGLVAERIWIFVAGGGLIFAGIIFAHLAAITRSDDAKGRTERITVLFGAAEITPESAKLERIRAFLFCGHLELNLKKVVPPGQSRDDPLMVEVTAWAGTAKLLIWEGTGKLNHKAFVMGFRSIHTNVLDEEQIKTEQVVATSLAFFGDVEFKELPTDDNSGAPGNQPGPGDLRPAMR
jgi:hypothetical protein